MATAAGEMLVVAAPSASYLGGGRGGYNAYRITRGEDGWGVAVTEYAAGPNGIDAQSQTDYQLTRR